MDEIVFFLPSLKTGGGNRVMIELANVLAERGHSIEIVSIVNANDKNTFYLNSKIAMVEIGVYSPSVIGKLVNLLKAVNFIRIKKRRSCIIYTDPITSLLGFFLGNYKRYRFMQADDYAIYDDGQVLKSKLLVSLYKSLCLLVYKISNVHYIFNSRYTYDRFVAHSGKKNIPFHLVHPAINHFIFHDMNLRSDSKIVIGLVGRKHPWKGLADFLQAWNLTDENVKNMVCKIIIVSHDDLSSFGFDEGFQIIKPSSDKEIAECFSSCNLFISPSWWEGFGLPPLEAMACGATVIVSRSGGVNEYCVENENCLMFEPKNVTELVEKLKELILNKQLRNTLAEKSVEKVQDFRWEKSANMLLDIIEKK